METTITAASDNMILRVGRRWDGDWDYVAVNISPEFSDEDVLASLQQWAAAGCPVAKLALKLIEGYGLYDLLAAQPGYVHGPTRLYRDGSL